MLYFIIILFAVIAYASFLQYRKDRRSADEQMAAGAYDSASSGDASAGSSLHEPAVRKNEVKEFLEATFTKIGANLNYDEESHFCWAEYQGAYFRYYTADQSKIVTFDFPNWYTVSLDNIEELSALKKAVNDANIAQASTTFFIADKDENEARVFSKRTILFSPDNPDAENFLRYILHDFFVTRNYFTGKIEKYKAQYE